MKKSFLFLLLAGFLLVFGKSWHWAKDGFHIQRIRKALPSLSQEPAVSSEVRHALAQPYSYLGRGHQCYAFASQDGKYVLKLPRLDRYELSLLRRAFPFPDNESVRSDIERRLHFLLASFQISFDEMKEETGVLHLHLHHTKSLGIQTQIHDRVGRKYQLNLDRVAFVLQEKKEGLFPSFYQALARGDKARAREILSAFLSLVHRRSEKGIFNKDPSFLRNFGIEGNKGIQIDIGSFYRKEEMDKETATKASFEETINHVNEWLAKEDLEMHHWFLEQIR